VFADPLAALIEDAVDPSERFLSVSRTSDAFCSWSSSRNPRIRSASSAQGAPHRMRGSAMKKVSGKKHREPSRARASLREMPEVNFGGAKIRRNPYALRIAREGISIHSGRGRPRKGTETGPTIPRSRPESGSIWKGAPRRKASRYMLHCRAFSWASPVVATSSVHNHFALWVRILWFCELANAVTPRPERFRVCWNTNGTFAAC